MEFEWGRGVGEGFRGVKTRLMSSTSRSKSPGHWSYDRRTEGPPGGVIPDSNGGFGPPEGHGDFVTFRAAVRDHGRDATPPRASPGRLRVRRADRAAPPRRRR